MIGIDTNILVRLITQDDKTQFELVKNLINKYSGNRKTIFISDITICELIWVLKSGYKYSKSDLIKVLEIVTTIDEFVFTDVELINKAINMFKIGNADFADYITFLLNKKLHITSIYSFDKNSIEEGLFLKPQED